MPLFLSEEEFLLLSHDAAAVAERADAVIRDLRLQVDTAKAEKDAAAIAAEQTCALLEQRYESLSDDLARLRSENAQLAASVEQRLSEIAEIQAEKHQLHLKAIGKDGEIERLSLETVELHKSKRQLLELVEQKDAEIREKNATIQSYLDKIVSLTDNATVKEARLNDSEAELARCHATCNRLTQEKELLEQHNAWLNEELSAKVNSLIELRKTHMDVEADLSAKLADFERQLNESSSLLKRSKERATELEMRITSLEEELCSSKGVAAANEEHFATELSTVTKLAELYKASSEEWSKKAGELEGVIKALETHLTQVENEYKEKLEKELSLRKNLEKEAADMKEKLEKCEAEIENARKANESSILPLSSFRADRTLEELDSTHEDGQLVVPKIPLGISGTALAASLLRDGWSLAKMYEKYQEAADALRHEKWGRKHAEAILERVLHEIEAKAEIILDERAEHERMVEAYSLMNQKLQQALLEHDNFENTIRNLKSELKQRERDHAIAQKEISDLQKQVTVLLKECQDIQLRCGATPQVPADKSLTMIPVDIDDGIDARNKISESIMSYKDIHGLVEQNGQLRSLVHRLTSEDEKRDFELRESFQLELQKVNDEATAKIEAVLKRSEEQGHMIESLHSSVAMYKRLYEEEHRLRASSHVYTESVPEDGRKELMLLFEGSQEVSKKAYEQLTERARNLEEDLAKLRGELTSLRSERDKMTLEASFARERLESFKKEFEHQRKEANAVSARNVELTHLLVDYQKRLRESSDSLQSSEENLRKLSMEVSILKHEKEILINSEKRASDEVRSLSERVHRLQSSLDTIQSAAEVQETARAAERRKHEEHLKQVERDWAEAKKELQEERDHVRALMLDKEKAMDNSMKQVDEMRKELADAWRAVASAESRAAVAEARCSDLEAKIGSTEKKVIKKSGGNDHSAFSTDEVSGESWKVNEEMEKLKEEAQANKDFMLQYKEIACTNEAALKQIESAHEEYKAEAEKLRKSLEDEVLSLRNKVSELERNYVLKCEEVASAMESKERELSSVSAETSGLRDEVAKKMTQIEVLEFQISSLKDDLDREHIRWRTAQGNFERQVILQAEAIQELTNTSKELSSLQSELAKLREISDAQKAENDSLKALWENEKSELQAQKDEAERKYNEINEQNKILHSRLESLHIRLAEREQSYAGLSSQNVDSKTESDLQNVIGYLRRTKEIAETEISLLKQEKLRLQSQLENAMKASERAQALLHSQQENSRAILFKDEEFKSLQLQVREINLLRESNMQLREENKHNFEECQKLRDEVQKAKMEAEKFENLLKAKQIEFDACQKEVEMHNMEIGHLNNRIVELVESCKNIDPAEHERMKDELQQIKILLKENEMEVQLTKDLLSEKQETISNLEQALAKCQSELAEQAKRLNDALQTEANLRQENEKQKKILSLLKKKNETLTKEKEELNRENQALSKQIEDLKSSTNALVKQIEDSKSTKKTTADSVDQAAKEKDTRIQILEKTLERERDDNKKEKAKRQKNEKAVLELMQTVNKDKKKLEEEISKHKLAIRAVLEGTGITDTQLPSGFSLDEETHKYFFSTSYLGETVNSLLGDGQGSHPLPSDTSTMDTSIAATGRQVPSQQVRLSTPHVKAAQEKEKGSAGIKPVSEARKAGRRLVRPRLERPEEPQVDIEMSGMEGSAVAEEGKVGTSHEPELLGDIYSLPPSSVRKRLASSSASELREESVSQDETGPDVAPPLKKSKDSDVQEAYEAKTIPSSSENPDTLPQSSVPSIDISDTQPSGEDMESDQAPVLSSEDIVDTAKDDTTNEEIEEHQKVPTDGANQEDDIQYEGDAFAEEDAGKSKAPLELLDECLKNEDGKEMPQSLAADGEDEREEGELLPDEPEQQQEDGTSIECQHEPAPGDGDRIGDETGEVVEVPSPEVVSESVDAMEEVAEGNDNSDHGATDTVQSPQTSAGISEVPPSTPLQSAVSEQQSANTVTDAEESRGHRTITISERARQNAILRQQARMTAQPPSRGRGRVYRRDGRGGSRGGRGGRGSAFGDREQV
ncbi:nuclear-pore anchor [Elaeis guineensis]|uniref:nuclear-pore anchor n=1 Tax=Elaeis guineensis var. tenera TaxID=51953 RepID=UPI00094F7B98